MPAAACADHASRLIEEMCLLLPQPHPGTALRRAGRIASALALGLAAACSDPDRPVAEQDRYAIHADPAAGSLRVEHVAQTARSAGIELVVTGTVFDPQTRQFQALVALRSGRSETFLAPRGVEVFDLAADRAWPVLAGCSRPIPGDLPALCVFWHWDSYGDRMLSPGETSEPVEWRFDVGDVPFDFSARLWWPHGR